MTVSVHGHAADDGVRDPRAVKRGGHPPHRFVNGVVALEEQGDLPQARGKGSRQDRPRRRPLKLSAARGHDTSIVQQRNAPGCSAPGGGHYYHNVALEF